MGILFRKKSFENPRSVLNRDRLAVRFPSSRTRVPCRSLLARMSLKTTCPNMCGRIIQSRGPVRYAIVDGFNVRDGRAHDYPPRWNGAPSQELLVIHRNTRTGEVSLEPHERSPVRKKLRGSR